jgi:undecaprenyl-diphosphatase
VRTPEDTARSYLEVVYVQVVSFLHSLWGHAWLDGAMIAVANYGLFISLAAFVFGLWRRRPQGLLVWFVLAALVAFGLDLFAGHMYFDARPFVRLGVTPLIAHSTDNGFPSDHSAVAAFFAAVLCFIDAPAATVAILAAIAIGIARVYALVHWPIDVIAGWGIGALPAIPALYLWRARKKISV